MVGVVDCAQAIGPKANSNEMITNSLFIFYLLFVNYSITIFCILTSFPSIKRKT
jgi:hypothetical protein